LLVDFVDCHLSGDAAMLGETALQQTEMLNCGQNNVITILPSFCYLTNFAANCGSKCISEL
jgi:hypothetical protein